MKEYFAKLEKDMESMYKLAEQARAKSLDPANYVEIIPTKDMAARVQAIVGPPGVAEEIRKSKSKDRNELAIEIVKKILEGKFGKIGNEETIIGQAVRTGVAILTEGVLVAPTEGISKIAVKKNPDGSNYLAIYFAGPIRSAGGTVAAYSVLLGDFARKYFGIKDYRPTDSEVERYVEEINLYRIKVNLQFTPSEEDIKTIVRNCPVCIDGDPTEEFEVSVHKNLERVETNRVRGGIALVIAEGIAQKAGKVAKYARKMDLDWEWIEKLIRIAKKEGEETKIEPNYKYLENMAAGRPIFAHPSTPGGFRLRYGRTRMTGIASKAIHPATMVLLDEFPAIGTQLKIERPGKGCVVTPCDTIDGPIIRLKNGSVVRVETMEQAHKIKDEVEKILFLGDILVSLNDFLKTNHPLVPGAWCEEYWLMDLKSRKEVKNEEWQEVNAEKAFKISEETGVPLHPRFTYFWHDISKEELQKLAQFLSKGSVKYDWFNLREFSVPSGEEKEILEKLGVPHLVVERDGKKEIIIEKEDGFALLNTLGILKEKTLSLERFDEKFQEKKEMMQLISSLAGIEIKKKAPTYIGARMGRPEKAKQRELQPAPHVLFPVGDKSRGIIKMSEKGIIVEIARRRCPSCNEIHYYVQCPKCKVETVEERICSQCNKIVKEGENCCGKVRSYDEREIGIKKQIEDAIKKIGYEPKEVKGVKGMMSELKIPERIEKGILRERYGIHVTKDGTCRFDATDVPLTHFYPREIGVSLEKLRELGYTKDFMGTPLESVDQLCELKTQDVLLSQAGAEFFMKVAKFVDDEMVYLYGMNAFYDLKNHEDLIGELVIGLSPHTSAGILGRIIGFTKASVGYAHPYFHSNKRRNADGDEDSLILLMDAFLNFSMKFLPSSRGGTMDTPRVLTSKMEPSEVDDEVHSMETVQNYPLDFYRSTERYAMPYEVKVELVKNKLGTEEENEKLYFTHNASSIHDAPLRTRYVLLEEMKEKVDAQFTLCAKIRAVDLKDAAERVVLSHFIPDLYGNLRTFARQQIRCVECNAKYRRVPLRGKCPKCGGKLVLTISKGSVSKYLDLAQYIAEKYVLPDYLKQRLVLLRRDIDSTFGSAKKCKETTLEEFL